MRRAALAFALIVAAVLPAIAQDPTKIAPDSYKVEGENDLVRIVRMKRGAHDKAPMHEHPTFVVVFLSEMHQKVTDSGGDHDTARKAGDFSFNEPRKHSEENLLDKPMESLLVELKHKALQGPAWDPSQHMDVAKIDPQHYKVEFENAVVRVLRLKRNPGETTPMHEHPPYVAVFLSDLHQKITDADGKSREITRQRGGFAINPVTKHEETSLEGKPTEVIVVELKKAAVDQPLSMNR